LRDVFKCPQEVRNYRGKGLLRGIKKFLIKQKTQALSNGGWHFTWMGGVEKIILKMNSMAHQELNKPELQDPNLIEEKMRSGGDILGASLAGGDYELLELSGELPAYLVENPNEFSNLLLDPKKSKINH